MHAFIVRPFGVKNGIDFERVDRELISPALDRLQMTGRTTQQVVHAGGPTCFTFRLRANCQRGSDRDESRKVQRSAFRTQR
jgi:hypothetical protein